MSTLPENEFDLEKLFLPSWAQEPSSAKSYANYQPSERPERSEGRRSGPRPPRREGPRDGQRERRPEGRPGGGGGRPPGNRGDRPHEGGRGPRPNRPEYGDRPQQRMERREPVVPLPEISVALVPDDRGVDSLARQIKMTGRAYPLFDIAQMILQKPERHEVTFTVKKNAEGQVVQPLFLCALDDTLWLSENEAVDHVLRKHFATFYLAERTATEPPKGKYTFVAQCGISGVILGPPNYHDYQNQLRKLHSDRFSRMPFEAYKARVRIVRDEEVVKKWTDDQSWKTEYVCLNMPEPLRLATMEAVEQHFRENHKDNIIKQVESHKINGVAARSLRSTELVRLFRSAAEDQRRFPLQIATVLSQQFATRGLQFFKVNKTITHVSVARPHYLDMDANPVSEGVKRIVDYINANAKCTRRRLVEALAPAPPAPPAAAIIPVPVPPPAGTEPSAAAETAAAPAAPAEPGPTPEQTAVIADLHWLIHQGHVIEFASGALETAKRPIPKPPKPEKPAPAPEAVAAAATPEAANAEGATAPAEPAPAPEAESAAPVGEAGLPASPEPLATEVVPSTEPASAPIEPASAAETSAAPVASTPETPPESKA